jgi:Domain of Unknown Function (DUF1080)
LLTCSLHTFWEAITMRYFFAVLALAIVCSYRPALRAGDETAPEGFESLFNGKDLTGWQVNQGGNMQVWGADNGILYVNGKGGGWLMTDKEYGDFELRLEFKLPEKGNSGVALRSPLQGNPAYVGMEIQILDNEWHKINYKGLKPTQHTGSIYDVVPPSKDVTKPIGEWNKYRITAKGRQVTIELNGTKIVDANLDDYRDRFKEHPGLQREKGYLGLQSHDGRVEFRNIYVKSL